MDIYNLTWLPKMFVDSVIVLSSQVMTKIWFRLTLLFMYPDDL